MNTARQNYQFQKIILIIGLLLFAVKILAWYLTNSVAVLTDALESTVNVVSGFIGLYSLYLSALPRDRNHPYGHGKVEFVSAAIEGSLITVAGLLIIYEAIRNLRDPHPIGKLDYGIILVSLTAIANYILGTLAVKQGKKTHSLALEASGRHLQSDTWSTIGIVVGLAIMWLTQLPWLDSAVALLFSGIIIYTGIRIIRGSLAGIMDEADAELLRQCVLFLQENRRPNWVDLHNLRIIKYGSTLHLDCHMTVPWYLNVHEAHDEVDHLSALVRDNFGESVELFVHTDGCLDFSCSICTKTDCPVRGKAFVKQVEWTMENISENNKHRLKGE